jgi:transcription-repair coupling factor (superfamily II helicase)
LGAGFRLALRDLEIRGAGNILGSEQSGHIAAVGFDLYCQLLEQAVAQLGKQPLPRPAEVPITMDQLSFGLERSDEVTFAACLPPDYIEAEPTRLDCYRRIARCRNRAQLQKLRRELKDRFGPLPLQAEVYLKLAGVRLAAAERGIQTVAVRDRKLILTAADGLVKTPDRRIPVLTADSAPEQVDELLAFLQHLPATQ